MHSDEECYLVVLIAFKASATKKIHKADFLMYAVKILIAK